MPKMTRVCVQCGALTAVLLAVFLFLYLPQHRRLAQKMEAARTLASDIDRLKTLSEGLTEVEAQIHKIQFWLEFYQDKFRPEGEMPKVMQSLSDLVTSNQLRVMTILPKGTTSVDHLGTPLVKTTFSVELEGVFKDLGEMTQDLKMHPHALTLDGIEMKRVRPDSDLLDIKILVGVFSKKEF